MKTFISSYVIVLLVVFVSPALMLGEEPVPVPLPSAEMETDSSDPDNQGVQSRGFFPKLPPSPKAPKMRSLSTNEKNLAKSVFGNTINPEFCISSIFFCIVCPETITNRAPILGGIT